MHVMIVRSSTWSHKRLGSRSVSWLRQSRCRSPCVASAADVASLSFGVQRKAELCHLPIVWIIESSIPAIAAIVAAPVWKLCPTWCCWGKRISLRMWYISSTNKCLATILCDKSRKKAPGWVPLPCNIIKNRSHRAEVWSRSAHHNVWTDTKLIALWFLQMDLDHPWSRLRICRDVSPCNVRHRVEWTCWLRENLAQPEETNESCAGDCPDYQFFRAWRGKQGSLDPCWCQHVPSSASAAMTDP